MGRRKVLLVVAAVVAALGMALVFLYVQGADDRAEAQFDTIEVLTAAQQIEPGETVDEAAAAGKFTLTAVPQAAAVPGHLTGTEVLAGQVANTTIYPGEQIIAAKFGADGGSSALQIPEGQIAISVQLTDTARVAGFVNPGSEVAVFFNGTEPGSQQPFTRLLLPRVTVLGVGSTTPVSTTTTDTTGAQTTEALPRTLLTLALDQADAQKVMFASSTGELTFALLTEESTVNQSPGVNGQSLFE